MDRATLGELRQHVSSFLDLDDNAKEHALIDDVINREYRKTAAERRWEADLLDEINTGVVTVVDANYVAIPGSVEKLVQVIDKTNRWTMEQVPLHVLVDRGKVNMDTSAGPTWRYATLGQKATNKPLSAADEVTITTESVSDKEVNVRVTGERDSIDIRGDETITTDSTDPVATGVDGSITWKAGWSIDAISTTADLNGYVKIVEQGTPANVLAYIDPTVKRSQYTIMRLQSAPTSASNLNLVFKKKIDPLLHEDDAILIDGAETIIERTIAYFRRGDQEYVQAREHERLAAIALDNQLAEDSQNQQHRARPGTTGRYKPRRVY